MNPPADDIDRLMQVMERGFDPLYAEAWNRRQVEDALLSGPCHYFLLGKSGRPAVDGEDVAGFYLTRTILSEAELLLIAVDPEQRGRGLGTVLMRHLLEEASRADVTRLFLEMRRGNPAENLYRKFGFAPVGERPNYYRTTSGERIDAITFALDVSTND